MFSYEITYVVPWCATPARGIAIKQPVKQASNQACGKYKKEVVVV